MKNIFFISIAFLLLLTYCKREKPQSRTSTNDKHLSASVRLNWIPSCSFAGEFTGAKEFSSKYNLDLKLEPGGMGLDPIKLVESGANTFGVAGADLVLAANDKGGDFVIIGLVSRHSPGVFLSKAEKNIHTIDDIKGKRIGELPGGNMQYLYEVFLKKTGLVRNKNFTPVSIPFDLKNFLFQDECDVRPVFIYDEPSQLDLEGIKYSIIEPKDFGIDFKGICYFCKRSTIERSPALVQAFINTMADGWRKVISNPELGIQHLKEFDGSINFQKELLGLKRGLDYFKGSDGQVLYSDTDSWNSMINDMKSLGFLKNDVDLKQVLNFNFVKKYHSLSN